MVALKIPIVAIGFIIWWAVKQTPEQASPRDDDGGIKRRPPHPHQPFPRRPRRGPHGDPAPLPPSRVRNVRARARTVDH
jgi:hypothetical protein